MCQVCKCLAARRCREEGLLLLAALLHCRLLTGTSVEVRGVVDLLLKKFVGCDRASMVCLAALLQHYPLPDLPAQADRIVVRHACTVLRTWKAFNGSTELRWVNFLSSRERLKLLKIINI